ncbi:MAG TPA: hypothetical protein VJ011_03680 [Steroidobacteraceae bacterium]|nr:hypothetical protein [Steroidobacteraceae bacterium]
MSDGPVCRSCKAPIRWAKTAAGKAIPLDREPTADGTIEIAQDGRAAVLGGSVPREGRTLYRSHFATCPNAASHRKPKP